MYNTSVRWKRFTYNPSLQWQKAGIMAISEAQQKAVNKYVKNNYDRINVTFPKGEKEKIKHHAESNSESVNAFITRAVKETMERDKSKFSQTNTTI